MKLKKKIVDFERGNLTEYIYKYEGYEVGIRKEANQWRWTIRKDGETLKYHYEDEEHFAKEKAKEYIDSLEKPELVEEFKAYFYEYKDYRIWIAPIPQPERIMYPDSDGFMNSRLGLIDFVHRYTVFDGEGIVMQGELEPNVEKIEVVKDKIDNLDN